MKSDVYHMGNYPSVGPEGTKSVKFPKIYSRKKWLMILIKPIFSSFINNIFKYFKLFKASNTNSVKQYPTPYSGMHCLLFK